MLGRLAIERAGVLLLIDQMVAHMFLDHLAHQSRHGAARGGNQMHDLFAPRLAVKRPLDRLDLPANAADARQKLLFFMDRVGHDAKIAYPPYLCKSDSARDDDQLNVSFVAYEYGFRYNKKMKTTSYSELRRNLASMIDGVNADHEPVIITRDRGKPAAVLMSLEDYASFEETRYLLASPKNAERLRDAIEELDAGAGQERGLSE